MITVFLDVDGVLNHFECIHEHHRLRLETLAALDDKCIQRLKTILDAALPERHTIVLSSSWRYSGRLCNILQARLQQFGLCFASKTDKDGKWRGHEIKRWLDERPQFNPNRILILDDDSDMLPEQLPFFVQTSMETGLTDDHVAQAKKILEILVDSPGA